MDNQGRSMKPERRTLAESVGSAMNSSHLEHRAVRETSIDLVGAHGAAALHVYHGADRRSMSVAEVVADPAHKPDPQDVIASELISNLRRIREAKHETLIPRTIALFAQWIAYRERFAALPDAALLIPKFAERVLHEWLSDRCLRCGGTGRLELSRTGVPIRGTGRMQRNALFTSCSGKLGCGGTGRPTPSHTQRRMSLGIDHQRYDKERWDRNFAAGLTWLSMRLNPRFNRPLTAQLERSTKRV